MTVTAQDTDAREQYATARAAHYTAKDLREAIGHYNDIIVAHPDSPEAGYSRTQILNIANSIIPEDELLESQMSMALAVLGGRHGRARDDVSVNEAS